MKKRGDGFFWMSFADLMTSLFFIVLVLYVITFIMLQREKENVIKDNEKLRQQIRVYEMVEQNLKPLKQDTVFFKYEPEYKRYSLAFDIKFKSQKVRILDDEIESDDPRAVIRNINNAGLKLQQIIDSISAKKSNDPNMKNVSYLLIISGYASKMLNDTEYEEYVRSYNRAWCLWRHWKTLGIDFENDKYRDLIDLQISGNGWGGVGRFPGYEQNRFNYSVEELNQRFLIQLIPKIGDTDSQ